MQTFEHVRGDGKVYQWIGGETYIATRDATHEDIKEQIAREVELLMSQGAASVRTTLALSRLLA